MDSTGPPAAPTVLYTNAEPPTAKPAPSTPSLLPSGGNGGNQNTNNNKTATTTLTAATTTRTSTMVKAVVALLARPPPPLALMAELMHRGRLTTTRGRCT
jgi:hypothetical protein